MSISTTETPAAQYLRMSTGLQEYSLDNQSRAIAEYAKQHGFSVVQTYSDPALSGVLFRRRKGLQKLIHDVVQGQAIYKAILVYDVSRWGRFSDSDESAYYEFLCKSAGVRVHYCAEVFPNDDALPNMIMKSLKRAMASEFSREMGVKVAAGQRHLATLGFRQGAVPGYGFRRLLLSPDGTPKQILAPGERKNLTTDRVILVPGPDNEMRCVRQIYQMFIRNRKTFTEIARYLNSKGIGFSGGSEWQGDLVRGILTHPKYIGHNTYGLTTRRLYTPLKQKPRSEWIVVPGAFKPLIDPETFAKAQRRIEQMESSLPRNRSDQDLLEELRSIRSAHGRVSVDLINKTPTAPSPLTYRKRFGTLSRAYELAGYRRFWDPGWLEVRQRIQRLRNDLMKRIEDMDPRISIERHSGRCHSLFRTQDGRLISVLVSRPRHDFPERGPRWLIAPVQDEHKMITLLARLNLKCDAFKDMFVIPPIGKKRNCYLKDDDPRLQSGIRLTELKNFYESIDRVSYAPHPTRHCPRE